MAILAGFFLSVHWARRKENPEVLIRWLERGKGNQNEISMRLNMARGDVIAPLVKAFGKDRAKPEFRAQILDLIFKKYHRTPDLRLESTIWRALGDPDISIRSKAINGVTLYMKAVPPDSLIHLVEDSELEIRKRALMFFTEKPRYWPFNQGVRDTSSNARERLLEAVTRQKEKEKDPDILFLIRSVVGVEISARAQEANGLFYKAKYEKADSVYRSASALDPSHPLPGLRQARAYLRTDRKKSLEIAKTCGYLLEIPKLPEAPVLDGDPSEKIWEKGLRINQFCNDASRWVVQKAKGKTECYLGHRDGKIYIAVLGYEEELEKLKVTKKNRDEKVWQDDCVELLFDPTSEGRGAYQFAINAANTLFDVYRRDRTKNYSCEHQAKVFQDRGYWAVEFAIAGKELGGAKVRKGEIWSMNVYRARIGPASEHSGIVTTFGGTHNYWNYPLAVFR